MSTLTDLAKELNINYEIEWTKDGKPAIYVKNWKDKYGSWLTYEDLIREKEKEFHEDVFMKAYNHVISKRDDTQHHDNKRKN